MIEFSSRPGGADLAYVRAAGIAPTIVWLGGFRSDMTGAKALRLDAAARGGDRAFLRFDYTGCGASGGPFEDGDIDVWRDDALHVLDTLTAGPLVLVGSSMGGWLALLAATARPEKVKALVLIAPAPDFTERLMWPSLSEDARRAVRDMGTCQIVDGTGEYALSARFFDSGRRNLILDGPIPFAGPVRILHGQRDEAVPWRQSLEIAERLTSDDVRVTFIKSGDHRLSTLPDLDLIEHTVVGVCKEVGDDRTT